MWLNIFNRSRAEPWNHSGGKSGWNHQHQPAPSRTGAVQCTPVLAPKPEPEVVKEETLGLPKPVTPQDYWQRETMILDWIAEHAPWRPYGGQVLVSMTQREIARKFNIHHTCYGRWLKRWEQECKVAIVKKGNRKLVRATAMTSETRFTDPKKQEYEPL